MWKYYDAFSSQNLAARFLRGDDTLLETQAAGCTRTHDTFIRTCSARTPDLIKPRLEVGIGEDDCEPESAPRAFHKNLKITNRTPKTNRLGK